MLKRRKKLDGVQLASVILLTITAIVIFVPFWNAVVISFESSKGYAEHPFSWWPTEFTLNNYKYLIQKWDILALAYKGTIILTVVGTLSGMIVSVMTAYVFSRKFPGKKFFFMLMLFTMFFGGGLIPTFLQFKNMGLMNTYLAVIMVGFVSTHNVIIMKNGFESVPMELQEAAMIDGANDFQIFAKVMLPLQKPLIATFSLFTMVGYWNSWYWPMLLMNGGDKTVLQLYLKNYVSNIDSEILHDTAVLLQGNEFSQGIRMAAVFVVMLPIMLVYPFLQKYFTKGIMVGAVKM